MPKVELDLDAIRRRLERQHVIEFSDVDFLIETLNEYAACVRERDDARAEATAWRESFDGELEGGKQLRIHLGAQEKETIWCAAERVRRENDVLKDAIVRVVIAKNLNTAQQIARAARVKVWGEQ